MATESSLARTAQGLSPTPRVGGNDHSEERRPPSSTRASPVPRPPAQDVAARGERRRIALATGAVGVGLAAALLAVGGAAFLSVAVTPMSSALPALVLVLFAAVLWRGASVIVAAPVFALILAAFVDGPRALVFFEYNFAASAGNFVARYYLVFLLGAILGRVLVESGCAVGVARCFWRGGAPWRAPLAVAAACALMTLGGVGVFVIAFAMQPIAREIYARARLPLGLAPAAIALGAFTATMTAIPGAPSLTNIIAASTLGTDAFAASVEGLLAAAVMLSFGGWWLCRVARHAPMVEPQLPLDVDVAPPPFALAVAPLAATLVANAALSTGFATLPVQGVFGMSGQAYWAVVAALALGIAVAGWVGGIAALRRGVESGAATAVGPLLATAVGVGFGACLAATPVMQATIGWLSQTYGAGTATFAAAATGLYAAAVGSSSGGLILVLTAHGETLLATGIMDPPTLHRVAALASGVLDTLPHSGAVLALLAICRATHAESYRDVFVVTVIGPALALGAVLLVLRL